MPADNCETGIKQHSGWASKNRPINSKPQLLPRLFKHSVYMVHDSTQWLPANAIIFDIVNVIL